MQEEAALTFTPPSYTTVVIIVIHKGLGLPQVLKKVLKKELKKNYRTQKSTQKKRCTQKSTKKSTHEINANEMV